MSDLAWPAITGDEWTITRNALHGYARVLGKVRAALAPPRKHWWHVALQPSINGLSTGILNRHTAVVLLELDLRRPAIVVVYPGQRPARLPLHGQSTQELWQALRLALEEKGLHVDIDPSVLTAHAYDGFNDEQARNLADLLLSLTHVFAQFRNEQRRETGPLLVWPHHFDLALIVLSGRLVPDTDPKDEEYADEQMTFGFSFGTHQHPEAYVYITAYPEPPELAQTTLPDGAKWTTKGFHGAKWAYDDLRQTSDPSAELLQFLRLMAAAGAEAMGGAA